MNAEPVAPRLGPLAYQRAIVEYLRSEEPGIWEWFSSNRFREKHAEQVRLDILKSTYRLEREGHAELYAIADEVEAALGLARPLTVYQAPAAEGGMNAFLAWIPGEAHVVLKGPVLSSLRPGELRALLGHELSHAILYDLDGGAFLVAGQVLEAMAGDAGADPSHVESARLYDLYTEVFADRGSLLASGNAAESIAALLKVETGLAEVSAESYLRQADEIFAQGTPRAEQLTHPEAFIRARALALWEGKGEKADPEVARMLEGAPALGALDLVARREVEGLTRDLVAAYLAPAPFRTEGVVGHARRFFPDFSSSTRSQGDLDRLRGFLETCDASVRDYFCYVVLDLVAVERELEDAPLARGLVLTAELGLEARFSELVAKELGLSKKALAAARAGAAGLVARVVAEASA